jgi:uncharacterized protein with PIN domain
MNDRTRSQDGKKLRFSSRRTVHAPERTASNAAQRRYGRAPLHSVGLRFDCRAFAFSQERCADITTVGVMSSAPSDARS